MHQLPESPRIQESQRGHAAREHGHHDAGGLVLVRHAGFEVLEGSRVVAPQHLQLCVAHPVKGGRASIAQAVDRLVGSSADFPVVSPPGVVREPDPGCQQLRARAQQRIVHGGAEAHGLLDGRDAAVRIENTERTDQASERVNLGRCGPGGGRPHRRFVRFGALDPFAAPVVRIAHALQELDLQRGAGVRRQMMNQRSRLLEHPQCVRIGEAPGGVPGREDEIVDGPAVVARLLEVPCQRAGDRRDLPTIGALEPLPDPLVQAQAPPGRYPLGDGVGIQAVNEAVACDLRPVGSQEERGCGQELPLSYELVAAVLDGQRIQIEAGRNRSGREFGPENAGRFEHALRLWLQAIDLLFDQRTQAVGDGVGDLSDGSSQPPAVVFRFQHTKRDELVQHPHHEERIAVRPLVHGARQLGRKRMPTEPLR